MSDFDFDPTTVDHKRPAFDLLPDGWYPARITEIKQDKVKTDGTLMLALTFEIDAASEVGARRLLWLRLCVAHSNEKTRAIARRQLSAICHAIGYMEKLTEQTLNRLCGHLLDVMVGTQEANGRYAAQNEVVDIEEHNPRRGRVEATSGFEHDPKKKSKQATSTTDYRDIPF